MIPASAPRKETFLARYPRKLKLAVTAGLLVVLIAPWFLIGSEKPAPSAPNHARIETPPPSAKESEATPKTASSSSPDNPAAATTALDANAIALNDTDDHAARLAKAPDPTLVETTAEGELPRKGEDGRMVWQEYARPFSFSDRRPRVSIVIGNMGMTPVATEAAIRRLPSAVTLAFDAQSPVIGAWLGRARQDGHETLIDVPMEPFDYARSDPGPFALLTHLSNTDNIQRLYHALRLGTGYIGITTLSGSRFTSDPGKILPIVEEAKSRGLMVFDARVSPHSVLKELARSKELPVAVSSIAIDADPSPAAIDAALNQLERMAQLSGHATGIASPLPVTLDRLEAWIKQLPSHGIALAPLSAMVE